jgi:DNA-binding MarR family transcriptional regulator
MLLEAAKSAKIIHMPDPCMIFRSASRAVTHLYDLVLSPTGMKSTQFIILFAIAERSEIAQWEMARLYSVSIETLSRRLGALRKSGLVEMRLGPSHNERLYRLTKKGQQKLQEAIPYWIRAQERFLQIAGASNWQLALEMAQESILAAHAAEKARLPNQVI